MPLQQLQLQPAPSAQAMVGSELVSVTPQRMGTDTHTRWVTVTVQLVPDGSVTQVVVGDPWQVTVAVPTTAVGVSTRGVLTSTH